jgi:6-phosphogluconolactonase
MPSNPSAMPAVAVVSCADSGELHLLSIDAASGRLLPKQVLAPGGRLMPMALHPNRRRLYVSRRSDPNSVLSVAIAPDGALSLLGEAPLPASMAYVACDRSGRWLLSASYGEHCVAIGPIDANGVAQPAHQVVQSGRNAHSILADPANRYVHAACLGADAVYRFRLDVGAGRLLPTEPASAPAVPGAGPRHLVFNADGSRLYLLNELDGAIDAYARDPASGDLRSLQRVSTLSPDFVGDPWAAELRLSPDGAWLLATERRASTLSVFAVDAADGTLAFAARQPVENQPRGMQLSPDGRHVLVAGQTTHHLASFELDARSGALTPCDRVRVGLDPNWIETFALPA